jgi:hypothetical protein
MGELHGTGIINTTKLFKKKYLEMNLNHMVTSLLVPILTA